MLKYVVDITFGCYSHRKFIFTDPRDALMFAKTATLHADVDADVTVTVEFILDRSEDQAQEQAENEQ